MNRLVKSWAGKTDEWLVEVLRRGGGEEVDAALSVLQSRHRQQLKRYIRRRLPADWVEDVLQEVWLAFYLQSQQTEIREVAAYLQAIARNKRADAVNKLVAEKSIENDEPLPDMLVVESVEETLRKEEEELPRDLALEFSQLLPFADSVLSDCQRVFWALRQLHDYPTRVVSRLLGKQVNNIDRQVSYARQRLTNYMRTEEFQTLLATQELPTSLHFDPLPEANVVVEMFSNQVTSQMTEDELRPLGLSPQEFQQHYTVTLIMPRWQGNIGQIQTNQPSLLLTRRVEWEEQRMLLQQLRRRPNLKDFLFPEACILNFKIKEDTIHLSPDVLVEVIPDLDKPKHSDRMYLSAHEPRLAIPVTWGFWDESLITPEVQQRWPFMEGGDWYDMRADCC